MKKITKRNIAKYNDFVAELEQAKGMCEEYENTTYDKLNAFNKIMFNYESLFEYTDFRSITLNIQFKANRYVRQSVSEMIDDVLKAHTEFSKSISDTKKSPKIKASSQLDLCEYITSLDDGRAVA